MNTTRMTLLYISFTYFAVSWDSPHEHVCEGGTAMAGAREGRSHHGSAVCTSVAGHPTELSPAQLKSNRSDRGKERSIISLHRSSIGGNGSKINLMLRCFWEMQPRAVSIHTLAQLKINFTPGA